MPLVKSYRRYVAESCFGVIASDGNVVMLANGHVVAPALEHIHVWDIRTGEKVRTLAGGTEAVTVLGLATSPSLSQSSSSERIVAGYHDGLIKLWNVHEASVITTFSGHRARVTVVVIGRGGALLVSGSEANDIILWDTVNEAGLFRLNGHKGAITGIVLVEEQNVLFSSSKDNFVKVWDLETQHCVATVVGHRTEVTSLALNDARTQLITGTVENELRLWDVQFQGVDEVVKVTAMGTVARHSSERVAHMSFSPDQTLLFVQAADKVLDIYRVRSDAELKKIVARRAKRVREKKTKKQEEPTSDEKAIELKPEDYYFHVHTLRTKAVIKSYIAIPEKAQDTYKMVVSLADNSVEVWGVVLAEKEGTSSSRSSFDIHGHRSALRAVCLSSDDALIASSSSQGTKIWNRESQKCIRSLASGYGVSVEFVPGNRHVLVGTKTGALMLYDISSGALLEETAAHTDTIWSISMSPDKRGFVTGSADHDVKFWEFELVQDDAFSAHGKRLSCSHVRTLKMADNVMCVRYSPDQRFIAVALLDATVKVFYADSLKFFLSLYGHKLPVLSVDISADSTLIATASADKNVKLWGLDFGDCHKSFFAHQDSVTGIRFLGKTHHFVTSSKDRTLKYWDGDSFLHVMTLEGHGAEVWGLAVTSNGGMVVSVSQDRSIRTWTRSSEILNIEEERENEREKAYEASQAEDEAKYAKIESEQVEATLPGKKSAETIDAADRLMEALDLVAKEEQKSADDTPNPILKALNLTASEYLLRELERVRSSELEEALMVLPFSFAASFLPFLCDWIESNKSVERSCRCLLFLMRIHMNQITSNSSLADVVDRARHSTKDRLKSLKDCVGFNMAGLRFLKHEIEESGIKFYEDAENLLNAPKKEKRRRVVKT